jgi:hypothetical protein
VKRKPCPHRSTVYGKCELREAHEGPHENEGIFWRVRSDGLTLRDTTNHLLERIAKDAFYRTGSYPILWLCEVALADATKETPEVDVLVEEEERERAIYQKALERVVELWST